jgi:putative hemolysin
MEILIILGLILLNGLFALTEIAVIAARTARLQERVAQGEKGASIALELQEAPNRFLSTIQIGITLVGTLAGAFGGASLAERVAPLVNKVPLLSPYAETISLGGVVLVITYLSLVIGELAPKRLALGNPEQLAVRLAPLMRGLARLTSPLVNLLTFSTQVVLRLFGVQRTEQPPVTDEEIRLLMAQGAQAGIFEEVESELVDAILRMSEQRARTIMSPRPEIVWLDLNASQEENLAKIRDSGYSRFPVCRDSLDDVQGMAYAKDLFSRQLAGEPLDIARGLRRPLYVPEGMPALELLDRFRNSETHVALVLGEYGGVEGLITLRDLMEGIVGQIASMGAVRSPRAVSRGDEAWLIDGDFPADKLRQLLDERSLPERQRLGYETLAGLVLALLNHLPERGETVTWKDWTFEVVDMDGLRIDQVLVSQQMSEGGDDATL